jgi:hypothetical protein
VANIDDLILLGKTRVDLGILSSCVTRDLLISLGQYLFLLPSYLFDMFQQKNYAGMWGHHQSKVM